MADKRIIELTATSEVFVDDWLVKDSSTEGTTKIRPSNLKDYIAAGLVPETMVADEYVTTSTYDSGDICIYEGVLYKALEDDITGDWDSTKWDAITISSELENTGTGDVADVYENGVSVVDPTDKIARVHGHKEVTQAQYDALPDSKLTDGIMYCIKDSDFTASDVPYNNTNSGLSSDNTQDAIDELASNLLIKKSIENTDIASFNDGANLPMPRLKVGIEPIQSGSGDPSPSNVRPISGWSEANVTRCGKNLLVKPISTTSISKENSFFIKKGTYSLSYVASASHRVGIRLLDLDGNIYNDSAHIPIQGFYFNSNVNSYYGGADVRSGIKTYVVNIVNDCYMSVISVADVSIYTNVQLELGSTATTYEPYNGHTTTIQFKDGSNPLTVYGGSLDVTSGVLTVDRVYKTLTSNENFAQLGANNVYMDSWTDIFKPSTNTLGILQCSHYKEMLQYSGNHYAISKPLNNRAIVFYDDEHATSVADFKAYINAQINNNTPIQVCYKLETPTTYQLTPTQVNSLLGSNNVWADTGKIIKLEYLANASDVIASLDARITALENA